MTEMTPWSPSNIRLAIEAHHWPPPTLWIRDMLDAIASAWAADLARIEALEKVLRQAEGSLRLAMVTMPESAQRDVLVEDWLAVGDVLGAKKETLKIEPMSELETAYMDLKGKLAAAESRIEALEKEGENLAGHLAGWMGRAGLSGDAIEQQLWDWRAALAAKED